MDLKKWTPALWVVVLLASTAALAGVMIGDPVDALFSDVFDNY